MWEKKGKDLPYWSFFLKKQMKKRLLKTWPLSAANWSSAASFSVPSLEPENLVPSTFEKMKNAMQFGINHWKTELPAEGAKVALITAQEPKPAAL